NAELLAEQVKKFDPAIVAIADDSKYPLLKELLPDYKGEILCGNEGVEAAAAVKADIVIHGISGMAGLRPLLKTIDAGNDVAFANKESLVTAGHIVMSRAKEKGVNLFPVDSEHSAIFQCLQGGRSGLKKLVLTASGGPFRDFTAEQMETITPEMALKHPTWSMGAKVTIDSSTMMNKGLEVIEAHWLFDCPYEQIDVLIQPQSVIHSMVCFKDGSFIGHLGKADMRIPIQYALTYPERWENPVEELDFAALAHIDLYAPNRENFPLLGLAYEVGKVGGSLPAVMNAANEVLVYKFLEKRISYKDIYRYVAKTVEEHENIVSPDLETILDAAETTKKRLAHI
ncbi:MAG: 1-deoxy-D-xylulose-5-phosphate reductoisomerase, partial [Firmicutes bacterium]|nr:1-deoxy-D-xylulose-5-phosphate reductoisomerase [Bacillota bacterium]